MLVSLKPILRDANKACSAVPCFNTFGIEYAKACISAAEQTKSAVILAINLDMANYLDIAIYAPMLVSMAEKADVPVCVHLDHCYESDQILRAMDSGLSSVMYDGSQLPLQQNIANTAAIVKRAASYHVSVEAELGSVPYETGRDHIISAPTNVDEIGQFISQSGCDALAVSVGNVHRLTQSQARIDFDLLAKLDAVATIPLVIHGTTGIPEHQIRHIATKTKVAKFNIGSALRQAWYQQVHKTVNSTFSDTLSTMQQVIPQLEKQCVRYITLLQGMETTDSIDV